MPDFTHVADGMPFGVDADTWNAILDSVRLAIEGRRLGRPLSLSKPTRPMPAIYGHNQTGADLAPGELADLGTLVSTNDNLANGDVVYQLDAVTGSGPLAIPMDGIPAGTTGRISIGGGGGGGSILSRVFVKNAIASTTHAARVAGTPQLVAALSGFPILRVLSVESGGAWCMVDTNTAFTPGGYAGGAMTLWGTPTTPSARTDSRPLVCESGTYVVYCDPTGTAAPLSTTTTGQYHRVVLPSAGGVPNLTPTTRIAYAVDGTTYRATGSWDDHNLGDLTDSIVTGSRPGWCSLSALPTTRQISTTASDAGTLWPLTPAYADVVAIAGNSLAYALGAGVNLGTQGLSMTIMPGSAGMVDVDYGTPQTGPPVLMNPTTSAKGLIVEKFVRCN